MTIQYALELNGLCKNYDDFQALKSVDLAVEKGEFFALLGPNGAGKSTIIGIICGLIRKSAGSVTVGGLDAELDPLKVRSMLGVVPQEFNFSLFEKARDIVAQQGGYYGLFPKESYRQADRCLELFDLTDKAQEQARMLSGGMKRRLMMARALVHDPDILILDEPTAGVDVELRHQIWDTLHDLNAGGKTIILTTHYLEEAEELCRKVAFINHGEIVMRGVMSDLLNDLQVGSYQISCEKPTQALAILQPNFSVSLSDNGNILVKLSGKNDLLATLTALYEAKIAVTHVQPSNNRLEDLFLELAAT